jgi:predicted nucleotide-binding protein
MQFHGAGIRLGSVRFANPDESALAYMAERLPFVDSAIEVLEQRAVEESGVAEAQARTQARRRSIFLVHGSDLSFRDSVDRWLRDAVPPGLEVVVLQDQPSQGRTLIEKFERYGSDAAYVVVLMTADDVGGPRRGSETDADFLAKLHPRARQNVVLEMGYFIGALGRTGVAVLYEEGVELPSDLHGIAYIRIDPVGGWKDLLRKELEAARLSGE